MSFGDLLGSLTGNAASITNPTDATNAGIAVSVGDLIFGVIGEQTGLTSSGVTDNLGNTYTAQNVGTNDTTTTSGRAWYARVTVAGTLTAVHFAATASSNNVAVFAAVFKGPFVVTPIDANPANAKDLTSPFACPATGTLSQARELVVAWGVANGSTVWAATSPNTLVGQATTATVLHTVIGYQIVNATTTVTPNFTAASNPTTEVLGTASFKQEVITRLGGKGHDVGLIGHWPLNEGSGITAHDISGNLNHGTLTNSPTWTHDPRFGNVLATTTAAISYVNLGDLQDANFVSTDSFSVVTWAKYAGAHFTASQATNQLTVAASPAVIGTITLGMRVETTAFGSVCTITGFGTGTGGAGTYTVSTSATVGSTTWFGGYDYQQALFGKVQSSGNFSGWLFYLDLSIDGGDGGFKIVDTAGVSAQAVVQTMPTGTTHNLWHLIAGVVDRSSAQLVKVSLDGRAFVTTSCSSVASLQTAAPFQIGNAAVGQDATYHDFRLYKRALSLAEINAIYNGQRYNSKTPFRTNANRWNLGVSATNVTLTGVGATASAGSFSKTITSNVTLTGASATTSAGTLLPSVGDTLTGASATSSVGSLTPSISDTLPGAGATASAGTLVPSVSDTLTGASATTSAGTLLLPSISDTLTGVSATSTAGSLSPSISKTLTGVVATTSAGTLAPSISVTLSGAVATANAGSLGPTVSKTLTGVSATITAGSLTPSSSLTLSGVSATTNAGSLAPSISKTLVGASSTASAGTLTASTGTSDITLTLVGVFATTSAGSLTPTISKTLAGVLATAAAGILAPSISKTLFGASATVSAGLLSPTVSKALVGVSASTGIGSFLITHQYFVTIDERLNTVTVVDVKTDIAISLTESGSAASSATVIIPVFLNEAGNAAVSTSTNIAITVIQPEGNFFGGAPITKELIFVTAVEHITLNETGNAIASATGLRTFFVTVNESGNAATTLISTTKYRLQVSEQRTAAVTNSDSLQVFRQLNEIGAAISRQDLNLFVDHEVVNAIDSALGTLGTHLTVTESGNATVIPVVVSIHTNLTESGNAVSVQNAAQRSPALFAYFVEEDALAQDVASRPVISAKLDTNSSFNPVPGNMKDWYPWLPLTARAVNNILAGKQNVTQRTITLSPNASQTAFSDSRIGVNSFLSISPISATASTDNPWFSDQTNGAVTINHASAASKDRTYRVVILG